MSFLPLNHDLIFAIIKPQSGLITGVLVKNISTFDRNNNFENIFYLISFQKE